MKLVASEKMPLGINARREVKRAPTKSQMLTASFATSKTWWLPGERRVQGHFRSGSRKPGTVLNRVEPGAELSSHGGRGHGSPNQTTCVESTY